MNIRKWNLNIQKVSEDVWEIPKSEIQGMLVPCRIYATEKILNEMDDKVLEQVTNVAFLPGIQRYSFCMPDAHWGYGFPIGGTAAFSEDNGVISPGGIGYDINCGVRLIRTNLSIDDVKPKLKELITTLFNNIPCGVGSQGVVNLNRNQFDDIMIDGAKWCIKNGYGWDEDSTYCEDFGATKYADPSKISEKSRSRGYNQLGTLGSGNHFLEIQSVTDIYNSEIAKVMGITNKNQILIMIHCGSRGFGHQVTTEYLRVLEQTVKKYNIDIRDRQLACAFANSPEGRDYFGAMSAAANNAFANRQMITHLVRKSFETVFKQRPEDMDMHVIYDLTHNIAKKEIHQVDGKDKVVYVHRKGVTRSFWPNHPEIPTKYKDIGQPVFIPGSMSKETYILVGTEKSKETFASVAHGAGRVMSRKAAIRRWSGKQLKDALEEKGVIVRSKTWDGLAEEAPEAYKDVNEVIKSIINTGLCKEVARTLCLGTIKG